MYKHISKLTEKDKAKFLARYKNSVMRERGTLWENEERSTQEAIDNIFDHKSPSQKAQAAREYFHNQKPSITDYLLWKKQDSDGKVYVPSTMPKEIKTPTTMQKIRMVTSFFEKAMVPDEMLPAPRWGWQSWRGYHQSNKSD